ncbi:hypothetical protein WJX73_004142 [Symbiochloris irregularis]|uniref:RsdA/BaiN/AoA(So)-like Rossmann fold-like domain-containing protein n=1 Tax=Symbiochloris irregularis TaxID=706552 RepID=A0AAW1NMB4_9CHLO
MLLTFTWYSRAASPRRPTLRSHRQWPRRLPKRSAKTCSALEPPQWNVIVIGAGAAGLTAGYFAAKADSRALILERNKEAGKKILISGGTRCNVCPGSLDIQRDFITESSTSALRAILKSWDLGSCIAWLQDEVGLSLAYDEGTDKWFPASNFAKEVRDQLLQACAKASCQIRYNSSIAAIDSLGDGAGWKCTCEDGSVHTTQRVVVATGGLSFPHLGTTGAGLKLLKQLGHSLIEPYPALTPLRGEPPGSASLAGISLYDSRLTCKSAPGRNHKARRKGSGGAGSSMRSSMLFTHRGFSGPAVLDLSHNFTRPLTRPAQDSLELPSLHVNWVTNTPREAWESLLEQPRGQENLVGALHRGGLPLRLAEGICEEVGVKGTQRVAQLRKDERRKLVEAAVSFKLRCNGHEGYPKAERTGWLEEPAG